eukprot:scaffold197559_cov28-Tisochrysis_lutea.AAC.1
MQSLRSSVKKTAALVSYGILPEWLALAASTSIACEVVSTVNVHAGSTCRDHMARPCRVRSDRRPPIVLRPPPREGEEEEGFKDANEPDDTLLYRSTDRKAPV